MPGEVVRTGKDCFKATRRLRAALLTSSALALAWTLPAVPARAQDATWLDTEFSSPPDSYGNYNFGPWWSTGMVPTGTAYFGSGTTQGVYVSAPTTLSGWTFNVGASDYEIHNASAVTFTGAGIVINGGSLYLTTANGSVTTFQNSSSAGAITSNLHG